MTAGWPGQSLLLPLPLQGEGWEGRLGRGCTGGQRNHLQRRQSAGRHFGKWRTEVWSSAAADSSSLLLLSVDSIVRVWRGLLMMSWRWDCPRSSDVRFPGVSLSAPVSCERGSAGRGSGRGKSPTAASPPETHQLESADRTQTPINSDAPCWERHSTTQYQVPDYRTTQLPQTTNYKASNNLFAFPQATHL